MNKETQEMNMLKRTIASRGERLSVNPSENQEIMVKANRYDAAIVMAPAMPDMDHITGSDIYVRETVAKMLAHANGKLQAAGFNLIAGYGYRAPGIQQKYWEQAIALVKEEHPDWTDMQAIEDEADKRAADPQVAGHITGGCVDVTVGRGVAPLDMGVPLCDFTAGLRRIKTFGEGLTAEQMSNRMILYQVMTEAGFMPFFGEYWHFMYGDREWAYFSGLDESLYSSKSDFRP
ncbi:MAG: hypothetical protein LBD29_03580 [Treponema sp.]|jgi:D-alanyl-D-alanine dipeptidase|nr:hypothetical protein [Treponema sp.]